MYQESLYLWQDLLEHCQFLHVDPSVHWVSVQRNLDKDAHSVVVVAAAAVVAVDDVIGEVHDIGHAEDALNKRQKIT